MELLRLRLLYIELVSALKEQGGHSIPEPVPKTASFQSPAKGEMTGTLSVKGCVLCSSPQNSEVDYFPKTWIPSGLSFRFKENILK